MSEHRPGKIEVIDSESSPANMPGIKPLLDAIRGMGYIITDVKIVENKGVAWEGHHKDDVENKTRGFVQFTNN